MMSVWQHYQASVFPSELSCMLDDEFATLSHSETTSISSPIDFTIIPQGTAAVLLHNLRFF